MKVITLKPKKCHLLYLLSILYIASYTKSRVVYDVNITQSVHKSLKNSPPQQQQTLNCPTFVICQ